MDYPKRKSPRIPSYDYSTPGTYFITICTHTRRHILSHITLGHGAGPAVNHLTPYGKAVEDEILALTQNYIGIVIDKYVIMPNHIHILISNYNDSEASAANISDVIVRFKSLSTRACWAIGYSESQLFQTSFHDHIIRNKTDYEKIWNYIDTNVLRWQNNCFYNG